MSKTKRKYNRALEPTTQSAMLRSTPELQAVLQAFDLIVNQYPDVSSYAYIRALHESLSYIGQSDKVRDGLCDLLNADVHWNNKGIANGFKDPKTAPIDFTIYYYLALYCKRKAMINDVVPSLGELIRCYGDLFKCFDLSLEVRSWYARRNGKLVDAYDFDKQLTRLIDIKINAGVYASFASSIARMLEEEFKSQRKGCSTSFWATQEERCNDWNKALSYMPKVIEEWKKVWNNKNGYGKHFFILGKLYLYSPASEHTPKEREKQFRKAKENFQKAKACENHYKSDYHTRFSEYERFEILCDQYETEWKKHQLVHPMAVATTVQNERQEISKPNEDFHIIDQENGIYLIADGVTRPHEEYKSGRESVAAQCAKKLCQCVYDHLLHKTQSDPGMALMDAMIAGNQSISHLRDSRHSKYEPCSTFIGAILKGNTLYFSNCCDTVGFLIRDLVKIQLTERQNHLAELLSYAKDKVYKELHNNMNDPAGFGIFNGDERLKNFLAVSHITLYPGDRIILASDGLSQYLHATRASRLREASLQQIFDDSMEYDRPPFQKYADDKTCIIIDI